MTKRKIGVLVLITGIVILAIALFIVFSSLNPILGLILTAISIGINTLGATLIFNKNI